MKKKTKKWKIESQKEKKNDKWWKRKRVRNLSDQSNYWTILLHFFDHLSVIIRFRSVLLYIDRVVFFSFDFSQFWWGNKKGNWNGLLLWANISCVTPKPTPSVAYSFYREWSLHQCEITYLLWYECIHKMSASCEPSFFVCPMPMELSISMYLISHIVLYSLATHPKVEVYDFDL